MKITQRRLLEVMPADITIPCSGCTCHATGYEVLEDGQWWNEYEVPEEYVDEFGEFYLGR